MDLDSPTTAILRDFLYVDRNRLSAIAAQLFDEGVLQSTKTLDSTKGTSGGKAGIGLPAVAAVKFIGQTEVLKGIEQAYDASWSLPLNVLDRLGEGGYIGKSIHNATLGQIVAIEGRLRVFDYHMMRSCWEEIGKVMSLGPGVKQSQKHGVKIMFDLMAKLPHALEMMIHSGSDLIWSAPDPRNLMVTAETLLFNFGTSIPGTWTILATVDGFPSPSDGEEFAKQQEEESANKPMVKEMQLAMAQMVEGLRQTFGRPYPAYAVTPLVIYRGIPTANKYSRLSAPITYTRSFRFFFSCSNGSAG